MGVQCAFKKSQIWIVTVMEVLKRLKLRSILTAMDYFVNFPVETKISLSKIWLVQKVALSLSVLSNVSLLSLGRIINLEIALSSLDKLQTMFWTKASRRTRRQASSQASKVKSRFKMRLWNSRAMQHLVTTICRMKMKTLRRSPKNLCKLNCRISFLSQWTIK